MKEDYTNILLITTDTQRTDTLRCMGSEFAYSPNLDRLAEQGVLFERSYTAAPACMPARCSILTGLYPQLHGCIENGVQRYDHVPLFTDVLKRMGYRTLMIGKTHFGEIPGSFDVVETVRGEKGQIRNDFFSPFFRESGYPENSSWPNSTPEEHCLDQLIVNRAKHHLQESKEEKRPFFLFCSLLSPHSPLDPPGKWADFYDPEHIPAPRYRKGEWKELPPSLQELCGFDEEKKAGDWIGRLVEGKGSTADDVSEKEIRDYKALYYGSAAYCDALVGQLLDCLEENGLRENTLVIFTSDHGQQYFDHGFNDKHNFYEETLRVPLIFSLPSKIPQGMRAQFASTVDIAPSIIGAAGGTFPEGNGFDLFTPLAEGRELPRKCCPSVIYRNIALVTEQHKLEYYPEDRMVRLFNLEKDPGENCGYPGEEDREFEEFLMRDLLCWNMDLINAADIQGRLEKGGPVAERVVRRIRRIPGNEGERKLNEAVERLLKGQRREGEIR